VSGLDAKLSEPVATDEHRSEICGICQTSIEPSEVDASCPSCRALCHAECWEENGGCSVYGCDQVRATEPRDAMEIPVGHWGRERKTCPSCSSEILAPAIRCRHCGTVFPHADLMTALEFQAHEREKKRRSLLRVQVALYAAACLAPIFGFLVVVVGIPWRTRAKDDLNALPPVYPSVAAALLNG